MEACLGFLRRSCGLVIWLIDLFRQCADSLSKATKTTPFLCIGAVVASSQLDMTGGNPNEFRRPKVLLHQGEDTERQSSRTRRPGPQFGEPPSSRRSMEIKIPSMLTGLEKATLDGLQFWADDLSRWAEGGLGATTSTSINSSQATSKAPSLLIGSRYFDGRTASSVGEEDLVKSAFEVKVGLDDGMHPVLSPLVKY